MLLSSVIHVTSESGDIMRWLWAWILGPDCLGSSPRWPIYLLCDLHQVHWTALCHSILMCKIGAIVIPTYLTGLLWGLNELIHRTQNSAWHISSAFYIVIIVFIVINIIFLYESEVPGLRSSQWHRGVMCRPHFWGTINVYPLTASSPLIFCPREPLSCLRTDGRKEELPFLSMFLPQSFCGPWVIFPKDPICTSVFPVQALVCFASCTCGSLSAAFSQASALPVLAELEIPRDPHLTPEHPHWGCT